jgi:hypothetical protein
MNADHLRYLPSPIVNSGAQFAAALALTKARDQVLAQLSPGVRVDRGVDGLVLDMQFGLVGLYCPQCPRDLLRRPQLSQHVSDQRPQRSVGVKLRGWLGLDLSRLAARLCTTRNIGSPAGTARQLATDRRRAVAIARWVMPCSSIPASATRSSACIFWTLLVILAPYFGGGGRCCISDLRPPLQYG